MRSLFMVDDVVSNEVQALIAGVDRFGVLAEIGRAVGASGQAVGEWKRGVTPPSERYWPALEDYFKLKRGHFAELVAGTRRRRKVTPPAASEPGIEAETMLAIVRRLDEVTSRLESLLDPTDDPSEGTERPARGRPAPRSPRR